MTANVVSEVDPQDRTRTGYRITGPSLEAVQREIDRLMSAPHIARAQFQIPFNDGEGDPGHEFIAFGQTFAREPVPA